jgi:ribosomal protein L37E
MGLFKPAWQSKNVEKALKAVEKIDRQLELERIVMDSANKKVQQAAANRLCSLYSCDWDGCTCKRCGKRCSHVWGEKSCNICGYPNPNYYATEADRLAAERTAEANYQSQLAAERRAKEQANCNHDWVKTGEVRTGSSALDGSYEVYGMYCRKCGMRSAMPLY